MKCRSLFIFLSVIGSLLVFGSQGYCVSDSLIINEIYYSDGGFAGTNQWIEIYNTSDEDIDLTTTSVRLESSGSTVWSGSGSGGIVIDLSSMITSGNSVIKANDYFLISNTMTIEIDGTSTTPNMFYEDGKMFNLPLQVYSAPTRGVRIVVDEVVTDAIMYAHYTDFANKPIDPVNPKGLDVSEFYDGAEPTVSAPILETLPSGWGYARKVDGVDTDENNTDPNGSSDWEAVALVNMTPTAGPEVTLPTAQCYSMETATDGADDGMLVFWEIENAESVVIYWKEKLGDSWNAVDGDALNDVEIHVAEGMVSFFDRNADPDMPEGEFSAVVGSRYYKCGAQY